MSDHDTPAPVEFACGCRSDITDDTLAITACSLGESCRVVQIAKEITEESGKSFTVLDAR